jgi:hypothetical protein
MTGRRGRRDGPRGYFRDESWQGGGGDMRVGFILEFSLGGGMPDVSREHTKPSIF